MEELCVPKKSYVFCFSILTIFGGKMTSQDWQHDKKIKIWQNKQIILKRHNFREQNVKMFFFLKKNLIG